MKRDENGYRDRERERQRKGKKDHAMYFQQKWNLIEKGIVSITSLSKPLAQVQRLKHIGQSNIR